jgi:hypothetical protein
LTIARLSVEVIGRRTFHLVPSELLAAELSLSSFVPVTI